MEMDQTNVEIRWGNCEKMADVLTREIDLWSRQEDGCKKDAFMRMFNCEIKNTFVLSSHLDALLSHLWFALANEH